MLADVIQLQNNAVNKLMNLVEKKEKREYSFRAPTGSGKTYMMADFMNRMLEEHDNVVFIVSSLSKSDLAKQNYEKFLEYSENKEFKKLLPHLISSETSGEESLFIPAEYNVYLLPRDLYKEGSKLMAGPMISFLAEKRFKEHKLIVWIKDECHIATKNLDDLSKSFFDLTINFSATPKLSRGQNPDVEITDLEAENCKLIKSVEWGDEDSSVESAIEKFQEIKSSYRNLLNINPCLIIQISNKNKANEELNNEILPALNKYPDLKWMLIVNDAKESDTNDVFKAKKLPLSKWKDYAKNDLSGIDVIIFKLVISEGWDIPRACMLYQSRNSRSEQLDEQVVGRVRRNPRLKDFETLSQEAQKLATTAWVWGIIPEQSRKIYSVKIKDNQNEILRNLKIKTTTLRPLSQKNDFDLKDFISKQEEPKSFTSIFELNRKLNKIDHTLKNLIYENTSTYNEWYKSVENIDLISKENNNYRCDYEESMEVSQDGTFPIQSYYQVSEKNLNISNWIWKRKDGAEKFSFDSEAERDWAEILKDVAYSSISRITTGSKSNIENNGPNLFGEAYEDSKQYEVFLWGKNYYPESTIKYDYYLNGIHSSYPDFVLKDRNDKIHIFEVKSLNKSSSINIDGKEYLAKVEELKKCYKIASKLTDQFFYLPMQKEDKWHIIKFDKGEENIITVEQFRDSLKPSIQ